MFISSAFAQTAPAAGGAQSSFGSIGLIVVMMAVMYFMMYRPQMKRQKEHQAIVNALAKGDEIVTTGGLLGKVVDLEEQFISVEIANGVQVKLQRNAVVQVLPKGSVKSA